MKSRNVYVFSCLIIVSFFLNSCMKYYDYKSVPLAELTMVNGYSNDQSIIYYINETPTPPLIYKNISLITLLTGKRHLVIKRTNSPETIVDTTFAIEDNTFYTSFTFASPTKPIHFITEDKVNQSITNSDNAGVRFFNLASINGKVSLQIDSKTSKTYFNDRAIENQASANIHQNFVLQSSGLVDLSVKDETGNTIVYKESVKLDTAQYYSIILVGKENDSVTPLHIDIIEQVVD